MDPATDPAGESPAPETAANPWESWGQVFQDPTAVNPHELHQHYQWVQDLRSDDMHKPTLERALRDWGYLQEGEGLDDVTSMLQQRRETSADPIAAYAASMRGGEEDFDGEEMQFSPQDLRQLWQQDQASLREEIRKEFEQTRASERLELEIERQLDKVQMDKSLDDDDRAYLAGLVQYRLQTGQVQPNKLSTLVADAYAADEARVNKMLNARLSAGGEGGGEPAPAIPAGTGAMPTGQPPVRSFRDIAKASMARLAADD